MKNSTLLCALVITFCTFSIQSNAQLNVANNGKVGMALSADTVVPQSYLSIGHRGLDRAGLYTELESQIHYPHNDWYNIRSLLNIQSSSPSWNTSICGNVLATTNIDRIVGLSGTARKIAGYTSGRAFGVLGIAGGATSGYNYGVCGFLQSSETLNGAGVYGGLESYLEVGLDDRYAGYFDGKTKVNGDLYSTTIQTTSDARLKTDVTDVTNEALQKIQHLRPISFRWKKVEYTQDADTATTKRSYFAEDIDYNLSHYGFLAQDVQELFPELVHEGNDGYLSMNYLELIPLLVQYIQELSSKVESLQKNEAAHKSSSMNSSQERSLPATLYQNNPNPFSADTKIGYQLPLTTREAKLYIYNMNGLQVAEYTISSWGIGSVTITAGQLEAGMYLYSLIADNQVIDTKRMILTK